MATPQRFPRPEFETAHELPATATPLPRAELLEVLDVAILAAALALAAHLVHTRRSRSGLVLLGIGSIAYFGFVRGGCTCPVGATQNVVAALANPTYLLPLPILGLFLLPLVFSLFVGRTFCSGVCPFGALQDLVLLRPLRVSRWLSETLGLLPHVYLGLGVLFAAVGSMFVVCSYDPFVAFFRLGGSLERFLYSAGFLVLAVFVARPYCRFLCPYGVLLGWAAGLTSRQVSTAPVECIDCRLCENACPVGSIQRPTAERFPGDRASARRHLAILIAAIVPAAVAGGWAVSRLDTVLARTHPTVRLAERVQLEDAGAVTGTTVDSRTFRTVDGDVEALQDKAERIRERCRTGGWLLGAYLGLVVVGRLIRLSRWRRRTECRPDPASCLACGRCFAYCPQQLVALDHDGSGVDRAA
jgi:ferredoxin